MRFFKALAVSAVIAQFFLGVNVNAETLSIQLYKLLPEKDINLKCATAEYGINIPVPERWEVLRATLKFDYINSTGVLADKSRLLVKFNDNTLKQINLNPQVPEGSVEVAIPASAFEPGYNLLNFSVSQHYTLECEQYCAADLWTTLKMSDATLDIEYTLKPVPIRLAAISTFLFDPKVSPSETVNLILENTSADVVTIAGIVASGIAKRYDYRKVFFSISEDIKPGYDNMLIGTAEFVQAFLKSKRIEINEIKKPYLRILPLPAPAPPPGEGGIGLPDPYHALVVVSGTTLDHVKLAAETLSIITTTFPNSDEMSPVEFILPDIELYGGRIMLVPDKTYTFKTLEMRSQTFKGANPLPRRINFRLPPDFRIKPNEYASLSLYYSYGAAFRPDSVLNIYLNDKLVRAIHLNNPNGELIEGYKIKIPTFMFNPGANTIRFDAIMTPSESKNCVNPQLENLLLTIFESSTLYFPGMPHMIELPKLELVMLNGFPLTRWPDGHGSRIYLTKVDSDSISATMNFIAALTQKNGFPLFELTVSYDDPKKFGGELILIGDVESIPKEYIKNAPLKIGKEMVVPYPMTRSWTDVPSMAYTKQISAFKAGKGFFMEFLSPYEEGRSVVALAAFDTADLYILSEALEEPSVQAKADGGLLMVDLIPPDYPAAALRIGEKYYSGKEGAITGINKYLFMYPWLYYASFGLVALILSLAIFFLLRRHRMRKLKSETKEGEEEKSEGK